MAIYILSRFTQFFRKFFLAKIAFSATSHVFCMYVSRSLSDCQPLTLTKPFGGHLVTSWWPHDTSYGDHLVTACCGANLCCVGSISPFLRVDLQIQAWAKHSQYHNEIPIRLFWGKNTSPWRLLHQFEVSSPPRQSGDGAAMGPNYCTFTVMRRRRKRWDKEDLLVDRTV